MVKNDWSKLHIQEMVAGYPEGYAIDVLKKYCSNTVSTPFFEYVYVIPFRTARDHFFTFVEYVFLTHPKPLFEIF